MNTIDNEIVREALINLDRSREKERVLREQANNLLEGLEIITSATGTEDMLGRLLKMVTAQLQCDDALILSPKDMEMKAQGLRCIGATDSGYIGSDWPCGALFERVLQGHPAMLFNVARVDEWQQQSEEVQRRTGSVLLISFPGVDREMLICCISSQRAYFNKSHMALMQRLMPIASHALHTLYINEQLQREIDERNRLEQYASFQAGIAEMSASVLHNIGNTITGAQGHLLKLEHQRKNLSGLIKVFKAAAGWFVDREPDPVQIGKTRQLLQGAERLLNDVAGESGSVQAGLDAIDRSMHHVAEIIQMQRGVSRPVLTATHFGIQQMVDDTLGMIEESIEKRAIQVEVSIADSLETLFLPRNPMIQMLLNLVKNSVESIQERKQTEAELIGKIVIRIERQAERAMLMVEDNGVGVEAERLSEIFKFGESSKERGSGFGLHSVANFIKSIEGEIHLESEGVNRGARMVVLLPVDMAEDEVENVE
jgi:signal transduction histidine kinase